MFAAAIERTSSFGERMMYFDHCCPFMPEGEYQCARMTPRDFLGSTGTSSALVPSNDFCADIPQGHDAKRKIAMYWTITIATTAALALGIAGAFADPRRREAVTRDS